LEVGGYVVLESGSTRRLGQVLAMNCSMSSSRPRMALA
jgi:hypothetical protein